MLLIKKAKTIFNNFRPLKNKYLVFITVIVVLTVTFTIFGGKIIALNVSRKTTASNLITSADKTVASGKNVQTDVSPDNNSNAGVPSIKDDVQYVTSSMAAGGYSPITVYQGIPVKWTLNAPADALNGCNDSIVIPEYNLQIKLKAGENLIEFTPEKEGTFPFSCWMGMINSKISVVEEGADTSNSQNGAEQNVSGGGCCAAGYAPDFANGKIPTDNIQLAKTVDGIQQATVKVDGYGYSPAVIVIEKNKKFVINFEAADINGCNSVVNFPDYGGGLDLTNETATPQLTAEADFTFECSMGMLHGYVKVVDDLSKVDLEAIKRDVESFVPSSSGGGCCST